MKTIVATIIILIFQSYIFSQITSEANYERYWHYRNRLKYFVKVEQTREKVVSHHIEIIILMVLEKKFIMAIRLFLWAGI